MSWIRIRRATPDDAMDIWHIEQTCFTDPWSLDAFERELTNILATYMVAETPGGLIGYAGAWVVLDEGHITNVAVSEQARRGGVASVMFDTLLKYIQAKGAKTFTLEVRRSNTAAISLYEKFGFEVVGYRPSYYADNHEDALMMELVI